MSMDPQLNAGENHGIESGEIIHPFIPSHQGRGINDSIDGPYDVMITASRKKEYC